MPDTHKSCVYVGDSIYMKRLNTHKVSLFLNNGEHALDNSLIRKNEIILNLTTLERLATLAQPLTPEP